MGEVTTIWKSDILLYKAKYMYHKLCFKTHKQFKLELIYLLPNTVI